MTGYHKNFNMTPTSCFLLSGASWPGSSLDWLGIESTRIPGLCFVSRAFRPTRGWVNLASTSPFYVHALASGAGRPPCWSFCDSQSCDLIMWLWEFFYSIYLYWSHQSTLVFFPHHAPQHSLGVGGGNFLTQPTTPHLLWSLTNVPSSNIQVLRIGLTDHPPSFSILFALATGICNWCNHSSMPCSFYHHCNLIPPLSTNKFFSLVVGSRHSSQVLPDLIHIHHIHHPFIWM